MRAQPLEVVTVAHGDGAVLAVEARSPLIANGVLGVRIRFPYSYRTSVAHKSPFIWEQPGAHASKLSKPARDHARKVRGLQGRLNLVLPRTAHPAFDKACAVMEIGVRRTPVRDLLADPEAMEAAIDGQTIMMVGSAPCFPFGLIDPIEALGELALRRGVWLHVDACVGGYMAPFVRMNGADIAPFDFEVEGVWSMSADLHKYGYCAKGASTVFFRNGDLKSHMIFEVGDWPAGKMVTPTLAGTRPGGAIAAAWAVMNVLGEAGYRAKHAEVIAAREAIEAG
ncbi:MAG TPA: pyridoxal-dependent decarboxylase, partial [Phenylobacterium sp.]|nr:pyridoxal-dependent decarboxylase [Phenylobacterium sp.]